MSLTSSQRTNAQGFPKPGELIEIMGAHGLEASDRALLNMLYQFAHDSGTIAQDRAEWSVPLSQLRLSTHESNDRILDSLKRLMQVVVTVPYVSEAGEPETLLTHLFEFFRLPTKETSNGKVRFGLPRDLVPIIARSNRWGRIKAEIVCAMSSRYAIALYEMVQLRANLRRNLEEFPIDRFRSVLGVPPDAYKLGADFMRRVLEPAVLEVNGLSDMTVQLVAKRKHARAPIEAVAVSWEAKTGDAYRAALKELERSKAGRTARLRGTVETVSSERGDND